MPGRWITTPSEVDMATCAGRHIFTRELAESHQRCHLEQIAFRSFTLPHFGVIFTGSEGPTQQETCLRSPLAGFSEERTCCRIHRELA